MAPASFKTCPTCGTLAALGDAACGRCGHRYRTQFHGTQAMPAASMPLPPVPGPATSIANSPPVPAAPVTWPGATPPLAWSADFNRGERRRVWIAPLAIGFILFMVVYMTVTLVAIAARAKRTMPHRPTAPRPVTTWATPFAEP